MHVYVVATKIHTMAPISRNHPCQFGLQMLQELQSPELDSGAFRIHDSPNLPYSQSHVSVSRARALLRIDRVTFKNGLMIQIPYWIFSGYGIWP